MGWLKSFIHSRKLPAPSLIKGYCIHMLARRAPANITGQYYERFQNDGRDMSLRGHLVPLAVVRAARGRKPGSGKVYVDISRRNSSILSEVHLQPHFLKRFDEFNQTAEEDDALMPGDDPTFWNIIDGTSKLHGYAT